MTRKYKYTPEQLRSIDTVTLLAESARLSELLLTLRLIRTSEVFGSDYIAHNELTHPVCGDFYAMQAEIERRTLSPGAPLPWGDNGPECDCLIFDGREWAVVRYDDEYGYEYDTGDVTHYLPLPPPPVDSEK